MTVSYILLGESISSWTTSSSYLSAASHQLLEPSTDQKRQQKRPLHTPGLPQSTGTPSAASPVSASATTAPWCSSAVCSQRASANQPTTGSTTTLRATSRRSAKRATRSQTGHPLSATSTDAPSKVTGHLPTKIFAPSGNTEAPLQRRTAPQKPDAGFSRCSILQEQWGSKSCHEGVRRRAESPRGPWEELQHGRQ